MALYCRHLLANDSFFNNTDTTVRDAIRLRMGDGLTEHFTSLSEQEREEMYLIEDDRSLSVEAVLQWR
eukprot:5489743-Ditylum_brightwellii.AAC.1